jgi:hypothetical protein
MRITCGHTAWEMQPSRARMGATSDAVIQPGLPIEKRCAHRWGTAPLCGGSGQLDSRCNRPLSVLGEQEIQRFGDQLPAGNASGTYVGWLSLPYLFEHEVDAAQIASTTSPRAGTLRGAPRRLAGWRSWRRGLFVATAFRPRRRRRASWRRGAPIAPGSRPQQEPAIGRFSGNQDNRRDTLGARDDATARRSEGAAALRFGRTPR